MPYLSHMPFVFRQLSLNNILHWQRKNNTFSLSPDLHTNTACMWTEMKNEWKYFLYRNLDWKWFELDWDCGSERFLTHVFDCATSQVAEIFDFRANAINHSHLTDTHTVRLLSTLISTVYGVWQRVQRNGWREIEEQRHAPRRVKSEREREWESKAETETEKRERETDR